MSKAILISDLDIQVLVRLLSGVGIAPTPLSEEDAERAAKSLGARDFIVVRQHSDGSGAAWAARIADASDAAVVFVADTMPAPIASALASHGVFVLDAGAFITACAVLMAQIRALHLACLSLKKENAVLRNKVTETKAVGRAKCLLMEKRNMSEQTAHRFIEKTAMDNRLSRRAVADNIIRNYEKHHSPDDISA